MMIDERVLQEVERIEEWDPDVVVDAFGITTEELMAVPMFYSRAIAWAKENVGE